MWEPLTQKVYGSQVEQILEGLHLPTGAELLLFIYIVCRTSAFALKSNQEDIFALDLVNCRSCTGSALDVGYIVSAVNADTKQVT